MPPIIKGLILGFVFIFALGPAFFMLIQTSIQQGLKKAIFMAAGISVADICYVVLVLLGVTQVLEVTHFKFWMGIFGIIMLISYGIYLWFNFPKIELDDRLVKDSNYVKQFIKGFALNALNPFIIVSWVTWASIITLNFDYNFNERIQFFCGMLTTIFFSDIAKIFIAHRLKHLIMGKYIRNMNRLIAIILVLFTIPIILSILSI